MAGIGDTLTKRPGVEAKLEIAQAFFQPSLQLPGVFRLGKYFNYYERELELLQFGHFPPHPQTRDTQPRTHADVLRVVNEIKKNAHISRPELRQKLRFNQCLSDDGALDEHIDLSLRLWLMLNVRDSRSRLQAPQTPLITWTDHASFENFITQSFPRSRWQIDPKDSLLHPSFTAAFMVEVCGLRLEWTESLADHLRLDRRNNILRVYTDKDFLRVCLDGARSSETQTSTS